MNVKNKFLDFFAIEFEMREKSRIESRVSACNPLVTLEIERRVGGRKSGAAKRNEIAMPIVYPTFSPINPSPALISQV